MNSLRRHGNATPAARSSGRRAQPLEITAGRSRRRWPAPRPARRAPATSTGSTSFEQHPLDRRGALDLRDEAHAFAAQAPAEIARRAVGSQPLLRGGRSGTAALSGLYFLSFMRADLVENHRGNPYEPVQFRRSPQPEHRLAAPRRESTARAASPPPLRPPRWRPPHSARRCPGAAPLRPPARRAECSRWPRHRRLVAHRAAPLQARARPGRCRTARTDAALAPRRHATDRASVSSSSPSSPPRQRHGACRGSPSTCASGSINRASKTPMTWPQAPAGLVSGPRMLNTVRMPSSSRGPVRRASWRVCRLRREQEADARPRRCMRPTASGGLDVDARAPRARPRCRTGWTRCGCRAWPRPRPRPPRRTPPRSRC